MARLAAVAVRLILLCLVTGLSTLTLLAQPPRLFVVDRASETLEIIDPGTGLSVGSIGLGVQPGDPVRDAPGSRIYVPNRGSNSLSVIDVATETLLTTVTDPSFSEPVAAAMAFSGREIWVLNRTGGSGGLGSITILDSSTHALLGVFNSPSINLPRALVTNPGGTRAYVVNSNTGIVTVILTVSRARLLDVNVGGAPAFAAIAGNNEVYVSRPADGLLAVIRPAQNHAVSQVVLSGAPARMVVRGNLVHVALGNRRVAIVNALNGSVDSVSLFDASSETHAVALIDGAAVGFVTDSANNRIRVFDPFTRSEVMGSGFPSGALTQPRGIVATGVLASIDLALTKEAAVAETANGSEVTFTIQVTNAGPSTANEVRVSDPLPESMEFESASATQGNCRLNGQTVQCDLERLEPAQAETVILRVRVVQEGMQTNTASVTALEADADTVDNSDSATLNVTPAADLEVVVSDDPDPVAVGQTLTYNITVSNRGASLADMARLTAILPPGVALISAGGGGANCLLGDGSVLCNLSAVRPGDSFQLTIQVLPQSPGFILFSTVAQTTTLDVNEANNTVIVQTTVTESLNQSDVVLSKTVRPSVARPSGQVVYTLSLANSGPENTPAARVRESLTLPGLNLVGFTNGFGPCEVDDDELLCQLGEMSVGQTKSVLLTFQLAPEARGLILNTAQAETSGADPELANNIASAELLVAGSADFNRDAVVDAGDLQLIILELTDGDGEAVGVVRGGTFIGSPGMDLNHDGLITGADAQVVIRLIFAETG